MKPYDRHILNALLDSYERSSLFTGENKRNVRISFPFQKSSIPEYFDESSLAYEEIHACIRSLEQRGFIQIIWKKGKQGHIVQKVILCREALSQIYAYLKRKPGAERQQEQTLLVNRLAEVYQTPAAAAFLEMIKERLSQGKPVKEYINLNHPKEAENLLKAVWAIETNRQDSYIREFSIRHFSDSKVLEGMLGRVARAFRCVNSRFEEWEARDILAEHFIYHTPNYVYLKGKGSFCIGSITGAEQQHIDLQAFSQGIGLSGPDLRDLKLSEHSVPIGKIITIENLTTFFRWQDEDALLIYLGGYLNSVRRQLLTALYHRLPDIPYFHFGDIDVGGFQILQDLKTKTGIPFQPLHMDLQTLKQYQDFARPLTANDRKRLAALQESLKEKEPEAPYREVLAYMEQEGIKLEQECVECCKNMRLFV